MAAQKKKKKKQQFLQCIFLINVTLITLSMLGKDFSRNLIFFFFFFF